MASPTPNKGMTYPAHGGAVNAWDSPLNANFDQLDLNLGGYYPITVTSTAVGATYGSTGAVLSSTVSIATFPSSLAQNLYYNVTGTLTQDLTLTYPAVGSFYEIANNTSGVFSVTAVTAASTSAGTAIPQGFRMPVVTDGTNLLQAHTVTAAAELYTYFGTPQGNVAGSVATVNGANTDVVWDATNQQLYLTTTTGSSVTAIWTPQLVRVTPQGYLTGTNSTTSPILVSDTTAAIIYYTPFVGNWTVLSNGTTLYPYQFSQMQLTLTGSQASNTIYDIFMFLNAAGTPVIGSGVAWTTSTAGSGNRGSGAGTAQLTRLNGIWVNAVTQNMTWNTGSGNTIVSVGANQGVYLGSIYIDSAVGQVTCHVSYGQSRKWGIWNAYNRVPLQLKGGDPTASWNYSTATIRPANNNSANSLTVFCGLAEECFNLRTTQTVQCGVGSGIAILNGIGYNSVTAFSGKNGSMTDNGSVGVRSDLVAAYLTTPALGANVITALEKGGASDNPTWYGTESFMLLEAHWRG